MTRTRPLDFIAVVAVQVLAWLLLSRRGRVSRRDASRSVVAGAAIGVPLGLGFDLVIGSGAEVFRYVLPLTPAFLVINGALSYGFAIATVLLLWEPEALNTARPGRALGAIALVSAAGLATFAALGRPGLLAGVFVIGGAVVLAGEGFSLVLSRPGPFAAAAAGRWRSVARLWISSVVLGAVYEAANAIWPVWSWGAAVLLPRPWWSVVLVTLGYVVLVHPMWLLAGIVAPWVRGGTGVRTPGPP